jgi:tRNA pseudouridine32 synthase/23S rRNA pseudouridine746 synthase/23S rRNA pseudouridine1911/1915/1917 synthase
MAKSRRVLPHGLQLHYEDAHLLVVEKPCGLLTMATERERERTAYFAMTDYVRKGATKSRNRIFIVHRLDREVSGLLVFAKSETVKHALQGGWEEVEKEYVAVVHGRMREQSGTLTSYLTENAAHVVHSTTRAGGKLSHTAYRVLEEGPRLSLLEVGLITGRKHQIRVHLADAGCPIVGDRKYGRRDGAKRLLLHARRLAFDHPQTRERIEVETPVPREFLQELGAK